MRQRKKRKEYAGRTDEEQLEHIFNQQCAKNVARTATIFNDAKHIDIVLYQSKRQKQNLNLFPDMLFIDTTHCKNKYKYPVVVFMVVDGNNKGRPAGYAVVRSETIITFSNLYEELLNKNNNLGSSVQTVVIDKCPAEIKAVERKFSVHIVICRFHVVQAMFRHIKNVLKYKESTDLKIDILTLITCPLESKFNTTLDKLPEGFRKYMDKHWIKYKHSWAACFMGNVITYGNKTNNVLERHNRILKTLCTSADSIPCMFKEFINHLELLTIEQDRETLLQDLTKKNYNTQYPAAQSIVDEIKEFATDLGCKLLIEQTNLLVDFHINGSIVVEEDGVTLQIEDKEDVKFKITNFKCCCTEFKTTGFPCFHLLVYYAKYSYRNKLKDHIPKKYHKTPITSYYDSEEIKQIVHLQEGDDDDSCAQENVDRALKRMIYTLETLYDQNKSRSSERVEELNIILQPILQRWKEENDMHSNGLSVPLPEVLDLTSNVGAFSTVFSQPGIDEISFISMPACENTVDNAPTFDVKSKTRNRARKSKSKGFQRFKNRYIPYGTGNTMQVEKGTDLVQTTRQISSSPNTTPKNTKNDGYNEIVQQQDVVFEVPLSNSKVDEYWDDFLQFNEAYSLKYKESISKEDLNSLTIPNLKIRFINIEDPM